MKSNSTRGTAKYIIGPVKQFDQKNNMIKRIRWDSRFRKMKETFYGTYHPKNKDGYSHKDLALGEAAWYVDDDFGHGIKIHDSGMYSWAGKLAGTSQIPPELKLKVTDSAEISRNIKMVAKLFGASHAGICQLDRRWIYSHSFQHTTNEHKVLTVPAEHKYAVVLLFEMDYELIKTSPTWQARGTEGYAYSKMAFTTSMLAQFIRGLGYKAIPSGNDTGLSIPLAIDAGMGELGRNGLLISPEYGPRARISKVLTDLVLTPDQPINLGVTEFCEKCLKCAEHCPSQAILRGERTTEPNNISNAAGELKWPLDAEKCFGFWAANRGSCSNCIRVCPFNKPTGRIHQGVRLLVKKTPWLDSLLLRLDDRAGYGQQVPASKFWDRQ